MKITLAFNVFNKERWINSLLASWIDNLSGRNDVEVIAVFDDSRDRSPILTEQLLIGRDVEYKLLFSENAFEIANNNLALQQASGDFIVFIQDDNWMHDKDWDITLYRILNMYDQLGAVAFLSGLELRWDFTYKRIEIYRPHKEGKFTSDISNNLALWKVDAVNRPFGIRVSLLKQMGGLDDVFRPLHFDDMDLSLRLLKRGYINVYVPFDVENLLDSGTEQSVEWWQETWERGYQLCRERHSTYIKRRFLPSTAPICQLTETNKRLQFGDGKCFSEMIVLRRRKINALLSIPRWKAYVGHHIRSFVNALRRRKQFNDANTSNGLNK